MNLRKYIPTNGEIEPLLPELEACLENCQKTGMTMIRHPLVYSLPHHPVLNAMVNERYRQKIELTEKMLAEQDCQTFILLYERPYRVKALSDVFEHASKSEKPLPKHELFRLAGWVWTDSENIKEEKEFWTATFRLAMRMGDNIHLMDEEDRQVFEDLPDELTIYRGQRRNPYDKPDGFSWSLSEKKAEWFAKRFDRDDCVVLKATIQKENVVAYFGGRGESEIVYLGEEA